MKTLLGLLSIAVATAGLRLLIPSLGHTAAKGVIETADGVRLADCPDTPNCHADSLIISGDPAQALSTLWGILQTWQGTELAHRDEHYLHITVRSRLMGFVDDVELLLDPGGADSPASVRVRSASRLGKGDLGANRRRIERLRSASLGRL